MEELNTRYGIGDGSCFGFYGFSRCLVFEKRDWSVKELDIEIRVKITSKPVF